MTKTAAYPRTPDERYFVVRGRLWRCTNPHLEPAKKEAFVKALMEARREVAGAKGDGERMQKARRRVQAAKEALGERGVPWWQDGAPDYNRFLVKNTPYADWWQLLTTRSNK